jgi:hypothetical protein
VGIAAVQIATALGLSVIGMHMVVKLALPI